MMRNNYAILRHKKIKSMQHMLLAGAHNAREVSVENADPERASLNQILIGSNDLVSDWEEKMKLLDVKPPRKNAVLMVELILTASPGYFRPNNPENYGVWDSKREKAWRDKTCQYLQKVHGERLVQVVLHHDEATPHIHAMVLPAVKAENGAKEYRLNARKLFFGHRELMQVQQDRYAQELEPLGLRRGKKGSKATHTSIATFYSQMRRETSRTTSDISFLAKNVISNLTGSDCHNHPANFHIKDHFHDK